MGAMGARTVRPVFRSTAIRGRHENEPHSEPPTNFTPVSDAWDYNLRDVMIPMRDGVKLHTIILAPKGASHAGMLLTRTPYEAKTLTGHTHSGHLGPMLQGYDNATDVILEDGYIRVVQAVRAKT